MGKDAPRRVIPLVLALAYIALSYAPILRIGPVAEDYQMALKGALIVADPSELARPFQDVWRPAVYATFAGLVAVAGHDWVPYRAIQLGLALALAACGYAYLLRTRTCGPWPAAIATGLWLVSPLATEPITGETAFLGQMLFSLGVLITLVGATLDRRRWRAGTIATGVLLAATAKESWVMLPILLALLAWLRDGRGLARAALGALAWAPAIGAYLVVYRQVCGFGYGPAFFMWRPEVVAAKAVTTLGAFLHVMPLIEGAHADAIASAPLRAMAAVIIGAGGLAWTVRHDRIAAMHLAIGATLLAPTMPNWFQASRWTQLPWLFVIAAAVRMLAAAWRMPTLTRPIRIAVVLVVGSVVGNDWMVARGDLADWTRLGELHRRLDSHSPPILHRLRQGQAVIILRDDFAPRRQLNATPFGSTKGYFPRVDDPFGIVSYQALLTWQLYGEGIGVRRPEQPPDGAPTLVHRDDGFYALTDRPADLVVRHPRHPTEGYPGIILEPIPWREFELRFP